MILACPTPASLPEFKDNVTAVRTEKFWDLELTRAKAKENEIKQKAKKLAGEAKLKPAEEKAALEKALNEGMSECERVILEKGVSNPDFTKGEPIPDPVANMD